MPTSLLTWELVVECSVAQGLYEGPATLCADYQVINIKAISVSHKAMHMVMVS